ncbi:MAG: hypothetical protein VW270_12380, partial [Candidatus Poseidoniales archaeon]
MPNSISARLAHVSLMVELGCVNILCCMSAIPDRDAIFDACLLDTVITHVPVYTFRPHQTHGMFFNPVDVQLVDAPGVWTAQPRSSGAVDVDDRGQSVAVCQWSDLAQQVLGTL